MEQEHEKVEQDQKNDFFIPEGCCPERFPSPTDCLSQDLFEDVVDRIRDANELLLDLALADDRAQEETHQKVFDGLIGLRVEITNPVGEAIEGVVTLVGYNFVVLRVDEIVSILPFSQIEMIKPYGGFAEPYPKPELSDIDPCLRRNLTFHFGEVVTSSPDLVHLFFRIRLDMYLHSVEGEQIQVRMGASQIEGFVSEVNTESIVLKRNGEREIIPIDMITLITTREEKP